MFVESPCILYIIYTYYFFGTKVYQLATYNSHNINLYICVCVRVCINERPDIYNRRSPIMLQPFRERPGALHQSWRQTLFQINIKSAERTTNGFLCTRRHRRRWWRRRSWTELRSGNIYHARRDPRERLSRPTSSVPPLLQQRPPEAPETSRIIPADHILRERRHLRLRDHKGNCVHTIFLIERPPLPLTHT